MTNGEHDVPFMTRGAAYAVMILGLICIGTAAFNIYLWNDGRSTHAELAGEKSARLTQHQTDVRAENVAKVAACRQSIPAIARANRVIADIRQDHLDRARQARHLAKAADPKKGLRAVYLSIAAQQEARAADLPDFPPVTLARCDALARTVLGPGWRKILHPNGRSSSASSGG